MQSTVVKNRNNKDSVRNTLLIAFCVSLICSILVTTTALFLKPKQIENRVYYSGHRTILQFIETMQLEISSDEAIKLLEVKLVDLETGEYFEGLDPAEYDPREAIKDPGLSVEVPYEFDIANINQRARYAKVYLLRQDGRLRFILLPVQGAGMWSTLYGYLALDADLNTIAGMNIYEHGETPGLGDRIEDPGWLAQWRGKSVYRNGSVAFEVVNRVDPKSVQYQVDAITGATITSESTGRMLQYWLGRHAYQPFLERLRREEGMQ